MPVIGREWHEDDPLALAIHDALVMQSKSLGNTLQTARTAKIAAEAARQQHAGAVEAERELCEMVLKADQGDWNRTVPTLAQYAEARLRELGGSSG